MTREVISVAPETSLRDVARLLSEHQISGVPVVDAEGACVGVVSEGDLLLKQVSRRPPARLSLEWFLSPPPDPEERRRMTAVTAAEAMTAPALTIESDRPLREAAALMVDRSVNRLPVVSGTALVGVITRADLVRAYLGSDDEIGRAVRDDLLRHTMWLDPADFDVSVAEGIVSIAGRVDRRSTAGIVGRLIGLIDGVTEVRNGMTWRVDDSRWEPGEPEREPGAASITKRDAPRPLHR
jgi:CBS domain-containing protein